MKLMRLLVGAVLAGCMPACSSEPLVVVQPAPATSAPVAATSLAGTLDEQGFLKLSRGIEFFERGSDTGIVSAGRSLCDLYQPSQGGDSFKVWQAAITASVDGGIPANDAGKFLVYSVAAFCPQEYPYLPGT